MELQISPNVVNDVSAMETVSEVHSPEEAYEIVGSGSLDFDSWTHLISEIEKTYSDNIKAISSVYEPFLSSFPLCHQYWNSYAEHTARLCTVAKAVEIFERAVQSASYSVGLWVDYCSFSILSFADPSDIRRIFERGLSFVGKDFLCHTLWDMYIRFELSQQQWTFLAHILMRSLKFPTKSLHKYYDNFKEFVAFVEEDMSCQKSFNLEPHVAVSDIEVASSGDEIYHVIKELQDSSNVELRSKALNKFVTIGERFYRKACKLHKEIDYFENYMERDFFDVKPLDDEQLENWHNYLDFIEKQEDFDWAVKLYERCLICSANYPEFWMRYVEFMESKGGRELATFALERATQVFLKDVSEVHVFNARFREKIGDIEGARAAFLLCDTESDSSFVETAINEANMEKRLGNLDTALDVYDKALKAAAEKEKLQIIPVLYIHFFRLKYLITGSADAAMDLLITGIQRVPLSRLLLEELINFAMMHDGSRYLKVVDLIVATAITCGPDGSRDLNSKDREDLSHLYMKFVDSCGTTHDIRKAWNRHIKSFPHLIRSTSLHKYPTNCLSNDPAEVPHLVAKQTSRVCGVNHIVQISSNENHKLLMSKNHANQSRDKDDDDSVKENTPDSSFPQSEDDPAEEFKKFKQKFKNDASGMIIALPALHRHGQNASRSLDLTNELQVSEEYDQIRTEPDEEHKHEQEPKVETSLKPVSLDNLSLYPQEKESNSIPATESAKKQNKADEHESERSYLQERTHPLKVSSENTETCCETKSPKSDSPLVHKPTAHKANIKHVPNLNRQNPTGENIESNAWPGPNVQYPMQNGEQPGLVQNTQTYNQMWQYQYQQQQYQQQLVQMQQSYLMQQQQQPYVQQQQQYVQQQQQQQQQYQVYQQYQALYQQYQQQQEQGYQQLMQQHQLQEYMQMQQYQQGQDVHQNHQQQIAAMANQIWSGSHDQQGQGTTPAGYEAPYNTQLTITSAPTKVESPNHQQSSPSFQQNPQI